MQVRRALQQLTGFQRSIKELTNLCDLVKELINNFPCACNPLFSVGWLLVTAFQSCASIWNFACKEYVYIHGLWEYVYVHGLCVVWMHTCSVGVCLHTGVRGVCRHTYYTDLARRVCTHTCWRKLNSILLYKNCHGSRMIICEISIYRTTTCIMWKIVVDPGCTHTFWNGVSVHTF